MELLSGFFQIGLPTIAGVSIFLAYIRPAIRLVNRTVCRQYRATRVIRATWVVLRFLSYGISRKELYRAACMRVESELLMPRPQQPDRWEHRHRSEYRLEVGAYRVALRDWQRAVNAQLGTLMKGTDHGEITLTTCFAISAVEDEILRYFRIRLAENANVDANPQVFVSRVHVMEGYVAPLQLLSGLLGHSDSDWPDLINGHNATTMDLDEHLGEFRYFQAFLFTCWLTWGPSASFGTCAAWTGDRVLQFGYGDESNSIALIVRDAGGIRLPRSPHGGYAVLAERSRVTGVIKAAEVLDQNGLCEVQTEALRAGQNRLVLEATAPISTPGTAARKYYSAYIWVIIALCDLNGQPRFAEPWRNILTFFEHGNIADETTYLLIKRQLATKVRSSLESILRERPDVVLTYACAIDDCGCGRTVEFPPPPGESMRELLFAEPWPNRLHADGWADRVRQELTGDARIAHAACRLPFTVSQYQRRANELKAGHLGIRQSHEVAG